MVQAFIAQLEIGFDSIKDSQRAFKMSQYMKNKFEFFGIASQPRKEVYLNWKKELPKKMSSEDKWNLIYELWTKEEREFQYAAVDWLNSWNKSDFSESDFTHIKFLISNKSWWDTVDLIASNYLGKLAQLYADRILDVIEEWSEDECFWLHRATIIYQLKYRDKVDLETLSKQIIRFKSNKEFFIQKAIGWALREVAKSNVEWVINFVETNAIIGLSKREALKHNKTFVI